MKLGAELEDVRSHNTCLAFRTELLQRSADDLRTINSTLKDKLLIAESKSAAFDFASDCTAGESDVIVSLDILEDSRCVVVVHSMRVQTFSVCVGTNLRGLEADCVMRLFYCDAPDKSEISICDIRSIHTDKKEYGHGYGSTMLNALTAFAKAIKRERLVGSLSSIDVDDHADRLIAFYEKNGFEIEYNPAGRPSHIVKNLR